MLKVMSTSCLKPYLAPVVFSVVGCASFTVWLGKIMELLVHQDLKFPLKIPFLGDMEDFRALACILWYAVHIMVCSAYYGMQCISWNALHSDNRPLCRCKKNFTNYDKYETSKVANLQNFSIIFLKAHNSVYLVHK